jgi:ribonucleotide reductase alpha subunit
MASGPVSFMRIFDCATENIKQGGKRRGANMGVLSVERPDIEEFIDAKRDGQSFQNFNLSIGVSDAFLAAAAADRTCTLRHPRTGQLARPGRQAIQRQYLAQPGYRSLSLKPLGILLLLLAQFPLCFEPESAFIALRLPRSLPFQIGAHPDRLHREGWAGRCGCRD